MRFQQILILPVTIASFALAQNKPTPPVAERLAAQNALFEEQYESDLRDFPERATSFGDYRYNDKLTDHSLVAVQKRHQADVDFLTRLKAISSAGFPDQD